jgi:hypothetical protein
MSLSVLCSQEPVSSLYPLPDESTPYSSTTTVRQGNCSLHKYMFYKIRLIDDVKGFIWDVHLPIATSSSNELYTDINLLLLQSKQFLLTFSYYPCLCEYDIVRTVTIHTIFTQETRQRHPMCNLKQLQKKVALFTHQKIATKHIFQILFGFFSSCVSRCFCAPNFIFPRLNYISTAVNVINHGNSTQLKFVSQSSEVILKC